MPVDHRKVAACLTMSSTFAFLLVYRGWHYFEWGRRGFKDWFYAWIVILFFTAVSGVAIHLYAAWRGRSHLRFGGPSSSPGPGR